MSETVKTVSVLNACGQIRNRAKSGQAKREQATWGQAKMGLGQMGTGQTGTGKMGTSQPEIAQTGTGQMGTGQTGIGKTGTSQTEIAQTGTGQRGRGHTWATGRDGDVQSVAMACTLRRPRQSSRLATSIFLNTRDLTDQRVLFPCLWRELFPSCGLKDANSDFAPLPHHPPPPFLKLILHLIRPSSKLSKDGQGGGGGGLTCREPILMGVVHAANAKQALATESAAQVLTRKNCEKGQSLTCPRPGVEPLASESEVPPHAGQPVPALRTCVPRCRDWLG